MQSSRTTGVDDRRSGNGRRGENKDRRPAAVMRAARAASCAALALLAAAPALAQVDGLAGRQAPQQVLPQAPQRFPQQAQQQAQPPQQARRQARQPAATGNPAGAAAPIEELSVPLRGQYALPLTASPSRIAVGDPEVADVKVLPPGPNRGGQVLVLGRKPGLTQLQVWSGARLAPQIWNVRVMGDVQATLAARGAAGSAQVDVAGAAAVVSGQAPSVLDHRNGVEAARAAAGKDKVVDVSTVGVGSVVQVEVKMVEVSRSTLKDVGINTNFGKGPWGASSNLVPSGLATALGGSANGFAFAYDSAHFGATLSLLESNGLARVLAEPTLLAQSGQSASFLAGGEIPVPEAGGLGTQSVVYKPFGIGLSVTPTVLSPSRIALKVAPEASDLDPTNGIPIVNGSTTTVIPALTTRKADTTVELGDGETFIISGLVSRQTKAAVNKVPFLGDLPIIGAFFRGMSYSQDDRELVIVVTPRLVRPIARGVTLPLPGAREEVGNTAGTAWGYYLMGPANGQQMPGFSR